MDNFMVRNGFYRIIQACVGAFLRLHPCPLPRICEGSGSLTQIVQITKDEGKSSLMILTTPGTLRRGTLDELFAGLQQEGIAYTVYSGIRKEPDIVHIEEAVRCYKEHHCDSIAAIGGGSVIDCAKVMAARIVRSGKSIPQMKGIFRIRKKLPLFLAVPTTAGSGSEVTMAAVVRDGQAQSKYPVEDFCLVPAYAVLDARLSVTLPQKLTAETGMDALTHAVESYTNRYGSSYARDYAKKATVLIWENLPLVYEDGTDEQARAAMLRGSSYAGVAFTNAMVGYVHAIAHAVGGRYGISHGLANAVILPVVLEAYGKSVEKPLAELADAVGMDGTDDTKKAKAFIEQIRERDHRMGIPDHLKQIQEADIPLLAGNAIREANPLYPVPQIWDQKRMEEVIKEVRKGRKSC